MRRPHDMCRAVFACSLRNRENSSESIPHEAEGAGECRTCQRNDWDEQASGKEPIVAGMHMAHARMASWCGAPNPRACIATARVVERRIESTSNAKDCGKNDATALSSPSPRERREAVSAVQSSCNTENSLMPAKPPYTKRSGRCRIWLKPSARSVASMPSTAMMAGIPIARMRSAVANASSADRSVMFTHPHCHQVATGLAVQQHGKGRAGRTDEDGLRRSARCATE